MVVAAKFTGKDRIGEGVVVVVTVAGMMARSYRDKVRFMVQLCVWYIEDLRRLLAVDGDLFSQKWKCS